MGRELESFRPHRLGHGKPDFRGDSFLAPMHRQTRPGVKVWAQMGCAPSELLTPRRPSVRGSGVTRVPLKEAVPVIPARFLEEIAVPSSRPASPGGEGSQGRSTLSLWAQPLSLPRFGAQVLAVQRP